MRSLRRSSLTYGLILWCAWSITRLWPLTRVSLLVTSLALVILRSWIPAHLSPVPDDLSFMLYYLETLVFPLMLGTLNFAAIEGVRLRVQSLLTEREQVARDREEIQKQQAVIDRQRQHTGKLESLGVLAAWIAHDFNNILVGVFGNISLAKEELSAEHPAWQLLEEAEGSMVRATHLSSQLLTFAKGGAPVKEPIDLENALIENSTATGLSPGRYVRVVMRDGGTGIDAKHLDACIRTLFQHEGVWPWSGVGDGVFDRQKARGSDQC